MTKMASKNTGLSNVLDEDLTKKRDYFSIFVNSEEGSSHNSVVCVIDGLMRSANLKKMRMIPL